MIFIGEKINGTRKIIQQAILDRNQEFIEKTALEQTEAGADYLDINAGTAPDREEKDMLWLIDTVQNVTEVPLCIDSSSPQVLASAMEKVTKTPMVNSINADPKRLKSFLPLIKSKGCTVIALALDESQTGMPKTVAERLENIDKIFAAVKEYGVAEENVYVDPLIMTVSTDQEAAINALRTIEEIHVRYPAAHITGGLSNVSFGLPNRALLNRTFLTLAMAAGLDSAVIDPTSVAILESLKATDALLGRDRFCRRYTKAAKENFMKK